MARKSIRRSQAVVPFGVGAIVEFPNQSLMSAGLDAWPDAPACVIQDARLAHRLGVQYFREPPPAPGHGTTGAYLPFVRFPLWHICPRCRTLKKTSWNEVSPPRCNSDLRPRTGMPPCASLPERRRWLMVPVRFVSVCPNGHIDEFPWVEWAHAKRGELASAKPCASPKLRLNYTGKAGLLGLLVKCESCGQKAHSLMGSAGKNGLKGLKCSGNRPWLGPAGKEACNHPASPVSVPRGATNLYFAKVASSILIPPYTTPIRKLIDDAHNWSVLMSGMQEGGKPDEARLRFFAEMRRIDTNELRAAVELKLSGMGAPSSQPESEEEYRYAEYKALLAEEGHSEDALVLRRQHLDGYDSDVAPYFSDIILVEKLAETRALTGFARMNPPPMREFDRSDRSQLALNSVPWLPAVRVYGEGIFVTLNRERLDVWAPAASARIQRMLNNHKSACSESGRTPRPLTPMFVLLHTLAHALIRRLSFECGYGSSSLRERLYSSECPATKMAGILIYTAAGDCEGTLGGLVRQGKPGRFERIVRGAIEDARWCGSDPLCAESAGQGTDSVNLAACHACTLVPETSCEEGNRFLDRLVLVGELKKPEIGFLHKLLAQMDTRVSSEA